MATLSIRAETVGAFAGFDDEGDYVTFVTNNIAVRCYVMVADIAEAIAAAIPTEGRETSVNMTLEGHVPTVGPRCTPRYGDTDHPVDIYLGGEGSEVVTYLLPPEVADKLVSAIAAGAEAAKAYA